MQLLIETDVEGLIGAGRHKRSGKRTTYRSGYRDRTLDTGLAPCSCASRSCAGQLPPAVPGAVQDGGEGPGRRDPGSLGGRRLDPARRRPCAVLRRPNYATLLSAVAQEASMTSVSELNVGLERDVFLRTLLRELSGTLQDVIGLDEAAGYISVVGGAVGRKLDDTYRSALQVDRLTRRQVADVLVDLKQRIQGDFYIVEEREDRIVLASRSCPFGEFVEGRPALCMMTSNVFGSIAAENLGYARVQIDEAIARGDAGCRVTVFLTPADDAGDAREYFRRIEFGRA